MTDILVRPPEIRQISEQLKSSAKKIGTALQAIDNNILSLKGDKFLGNRANAVQAHYAPKREALLKAREIVAHFANDLQEAAARFEQADKSGQNLQIEQNKPGVVNGKLDIQKEYDKFQVPTAEQNGLVEVPDKWIADLFGLQRRKVTMTEKKLMDEIGLLGQKKLYDIQKESFEMAVKFAGENGQEDGLGDAYRHAYWNALMVREFGADWAKKFASAHETIPDNPKSKAFMDMWNNEVGRNIAQNNSDLTKQELAEKIADAVRNGDTVIIDGQTQMPVYSDQSEGVKNLPNPNAPSN